MLQPCAFFGARDPERAAERPLLGVLVHIIGTSAPIWGHDERMRRPKRY